MMRFLYFYTMRNAPDAVRQVAPSHVEYWQGRKLPSYLGGPFADRSGGPITFAAANLEDAKRIVEADPFVRERLIEQSWVKEWHVG